MLTGVPPEVHGVTWNSDLRGERRYPNRPTLFELARAAGFTTAMVAGKTKFVTLAKPGTVDWSLVSRTKDAIVADRAADLIRAHAPQVMFVHFPGVDHAGHTWGWGSAIQRGAIAAADRCVGRLLDALRDRGVLDSTVVFVTADHGGRGRSHPPSDPRSWTIPWIVSGAGIRSGLDLSDMEIHTEDTFATACWLLGIEPQEPIQGRPVRSILTPGIESDTTRRRPAPVRG
jgi:arylsulfatase A-like enzyme